MRLLITGFGAFGPVIDNPARRLALALDGCTVPGCAVVGHEIPVSYVRGVERTLQLAESAQAVLGVGVAAGRTAPMLERFAHRHAGERPDVDGNHSPRWGRGDPERIESTLDVSRWARALGCEISEDAGHYVCNAWLYQVRRRLDIPVGFLHVPPSGVDPTWVMAGLRELMIPPAPRVG